jgi:nitric oxide reductase subunit B
VRPLQIGRGWVQAAALVSLTGFFVVVLMGFLTYQSGPPIPARTVSASGATVFTGADVHAGQDVFLRNGLMEYGSIFGHGAYLGPDFTADYLHRCAELVKSSYGGAGPDSAAQRTQADFTTNRYDAATGVLTVSGAQAAAFTTLRAHYAGEFASSPPGSS